MRIKLIKISRLQAFWYIFFALMVLLYPLVLAQINDDCTIYGNCKPAVVGITFSNTTGAVNTSLYWGPYLYSDYNMPTINSFAYNQTAPAISYCDDTFLNLSGTNANQNLNVAPWNITASSLNVPFGGSFTSYSSVGNPVQMLKVDASNDLIFGQSNYNLWKIGVGTQGSIMSDGGFTSRQVKIKTHEITRVTVQYDGSVSFNGNAIYNINNISVNNISVVNLNVSRNIQAENITADWFFGKTIVSFSKLTDLNSTYAQDFKTINGKLYLNTTYSLSNNILYNNSAEKSTTENSPIKIKETKITSGIGNSITIRIKFDMKGVLAGLELGNPCCQIYRNSMVVGTEQCDSSGIYTTFSEDIAGWSNSDLLQLYCIADDPEEVTTVYGKNLIIAGDINIAGRVGEFASQDP